MKYIDKITELLEEKKAVENRRKDLINSSTNQPPIRFVVEFKFEVFQLVENPKLMDAALKGVINAFDRRIVEIIDELRIMDEVLASYAASNGGDPL
jgi:hypothetical protein